MEVSSHALNMGRVYGFKYDYVVFTNFTKDHLDFHLDMNNYLHSKTKLFDMVKENGKLKGTSPIGQVIETNLAGKQATSITADMFEN